MPTRLRCAAASAAPASVPTPTPAANKGPAARIDLNRPWADPREPDADPMTHLQWAEREARRLAVSTACNFRWCSQEADDLVAVAVLTLLKLAPRFDPSLVRADSSRDQLFRGWAHKWLKKECEREAERLVNAGWYNSTSKRELKTFARSGSALPPQLRCPSCTEVMLGRTRDGRDEPEEDDEGRAPVATRFEPRLVILRAGVEVGGSEEKAPPG